VDPAALEWEHRLPLLLAELREADADIICLQEVNRLEDIAQGLPGYSSAYLRKNCEQTRFGCPMDGCAVLYRAERFRLASQPCLRWAPAACAAPQLLRCAARCARTARWAPAARRAPAAGP
jgi:mRNA deadenylase 3'-5' endonuclease subunit Ccr4